MFYWWRKPEYTEKTTELLQVTDKLKLTDRCNYSVKLRSDIDSFITIISEKSHNVETLLFTVVFIKLSIHVGLA